MTSPKHVGVITIPTKIVLKNPGVFGGDSTACSEICSDLNVSALPQLIARHLTLAETGCWLWTGYLQKNGYARIKWDGKLRLIHRVAYTLLVGPIPKRRQMDHLCRVRHCCNPAHLDIVTNAENTRRGLSANHSVCRKGLHLWIPENISIGRRGERICRLCRNARQNAKARQRRMMGLPRVRRRVPVDPITKTLEFRQAEMRRRMAKTYQEVFNFSEASS